MAFLKAFGSYVPARVVGNAEMAALAGCEAEWIESVSGISERRYAAESETVVDMAQRAGEECLARASADRSRIGMVIVSSGSSERRFPGPAAETASRLGLAGVPAIDVPMASAGSLFGMALGVQSGAGQVLVIASEKMSAVISGAAVDKNALLDKNTGILFGDGAGACLIDAKEGLAEVTDWSLHSDGSFASNLRLEFGQPLYMDGRTVIMQASRKVPAVIREVLERTHHAPSAIGAFLMHQANQNLIVRIAKALEVGPETFFSNIGRYGNTSSASLLIAASEWVAGRGFRPSEPVIFAVFGAGFHWGALLAVGC